MKKSILTLALTAGLAAVSGVAAAYDAGDLVLRAGYTNVAPNDDSGAVLVDGADSGLTVGVDDNAQLGLNIVYFYDNNWAIEVLAATPFSHDIIVHTPDGNAKLAETKHLPPTVSALYFFNEKDAAFQPYAGVGVNYTVFFDEDFTSTFKDAGFSDLDLDSSFGLAAQVGFDYKLNDNWMVNASVRYIDIDTTANFSAGAAKGKVDVDINPTVVSLMVGYKF